MATAVEERVSKLEGAYEHLATKADIADLHTSISKLEIRISKDSRTLVMWIAGLQVAMVIALATVLRLLGGG